MELPAKTPNVLLLVFVNGVKQSSFQGSQFRPQGDYEVSGSYIRFAFKVMSHDLVSFVTLSSDGPSEFEVEVPYTYDARQWFDPANPHDPKVTKIDAPAPTVTQL